MKKGLLGILFIGLTGSLFSQQKGTKDLVLLKQYMVGNFENAKQVESDSSIEWLSMQIKQVWTKRKDGFWLYVEQIHPKEPALPVFQHMFHIYVQDDSTLICQEFEFKEPATYIGWWKTPLRFDSVKFSALSNRLGCEVYLRKNTLGQFIGTTDGNECISHKDGASYSTTEMQIDKTGLHYWERGWNTDGNIVWVRSKGAIQFKKGIRKK